MHVRFMQKVDYYVGVPLCFLVSLFHRIKNLLSPASTISEIDRILFVELSEMGSAILAHPTLQKAAALAGKNNIYFLIFEANRESVEVLGVIPDSNIITINSKSFLTFLLSGLKAMFKIRKLNFSVCLDLELFSRCTTLICYFSGAKIRAGFHNYSEEGLYRGNLLTHKLFYNSGLHMSESFLALFEAITCEKKELPLLKRKIILNPVPLPQYEPPPDDLAKTKLLLSKFGYPTEGAKLFILNPDPGLLHLRGWPVENYAALAKYIIDQSMSNYVGIAGLKHSVNFYDFINNFCKDSRILNFTGETANLKELLALLAFTNCLITNDSGLAHMAALTATKTIVLFGPETPLRYSPLGNNSISIFAGLACSPCFSAANHRHSVCTNNICMQEIKLEHVTEKLRELCE